MRPKANISFFSSQILSFAEASDVTDFWDGVGVTHGADVLMVREISYDCTLCVSGMFHNNRALISLYSSSAGTSYTANC